MSLKMKRVVPIILLLIVILFFLALAIGGQGIIAYSI